MGRWSWIIQVGLMGSHLTLLKGGRMVRVRGDVTRSRSPREIDLKMLTVGFEDGVRGHRSRNAGTSRIWQRQRNDSPLEPPKWHSPAGTLPWATWKWFQTSQNSKRTNLCCSTPLRCGYLLQRHKRDGWKASLIFRTIKRQAENPAIPFNSKPSRLFRK